MPLIDGRHVCAMAHSDFTLPGAEKHYPPDTEIEPIHTAIDLRLDLDAQAATGSVIHTVAARRPGPHKLTLDAVALNVEGVRDPDDRAVTWSYDGQVIEVTWAEALAEGEERRLQVDYSVTKPTGGLYFSKPSEAYPDEPWYAATDHETERARHWLPCVDLPTVRPRLDIRLTAKRDFTILANGALQGETENEDGTKTAHWRLDFPCPSYLTCFAVGDFIRADDQAFGDVPVAYFTTRPHSTEDLLRSFGRTPDMLRWLTAKLDRRFPFPKYFQFALPGFGGAMENISLVSWNDLFVLDETLAREWTQLVDAVNIHEMAHSYFGDAIVIRDYAHAWLKESWATYIEQCWWEDNVSQDEALYDYYVNAHAYFDEADTSYKRPIVTREFNSSWDMYDRHLYPGGACRLHTLRRELGDDAFWAAVRDYVARYEGKVVETEDFRRIMEEHSGRSLVQWFEQWIYTPGYPALKVTFKHDANKKQGRFDIEQTQVDANDGSGAFRFPLELGWVTKDGLQTREVRIEEKKHTLVIPMDTDPHQVRVDPGTRVLHKLEFNPGDAKLEAQLTGAPDVPGRILAARELVKAGTSKGLKAVRAAYSKEQFWGVKAQIAKLLGESGNQAAADVLAEIIGEEKDPRVLMAVLMAAAKYRDAGIQTALQAKLADDLGYQARRLIYEALGAQRAGAPFDMLADAASRDGPTGLVQAGAFRGLAASRREEAIPLLLHRAAFGATSNRARPAAVASLGDIGRVQDKAERERIAESLIDLLRDPHIRVRQAAVAGLRTMGAGEALGALESYRRGLPSQEQVGVDRAAKAIRDAQKPPAKVAEKDLEEVRDSLRKLKERVEELGAKLDAREDDGAGRPAAKAAKNGRKAKK